MLPRIYRHCSPIAYFVAKTLHKYDRQQSLAYLFADSNFTLIQTDTIVALSTPPGIGAIAVIRLSGSDAIDITQKLFHGKDLSQQQTHTAHFGKLIFNGEELDEVVVTLYKAPRSYTKENLVEISCHGSPYIIQRVLEALLQSGARAADAGEFTMRAFLNGRFDLAQAEAVADLIASDSAASHRLALGQLRGGVSNKIKQLREELIHFASLLELELDFAEEDVEFADRTQLNALVDNVMNTVNDMLDAFKLGNALKNGVNTVIAGRPNAGKSTLLNALLNEERAIVSAIPGTTRDTIEETLNVDGILFRLIDTAGIREAEDEIERIGVSRTMEAVQRSAVVVYVFDVNEVTESEIKSDVQKLQTENTTIILVGNKSDMVSSELLKQKFNGLVDVLFISAKEKQGLEKLRDALTQSVLQGRTSVPDTLVTNARHNEALRQSANALVDARQGIEAGASKELIALDIRRAIQSLGEIIGAVSTDDLLDNVFSKFCIGK